MPLALAAAAAGVLADRPSRALTGTAALLVLLVVYRLVLDWHAVAVTPSLAAWTWSLVLGTVHVGGSGAAPPDGPPPH